MTKKNTSIWIEDRAQKKLKALSKKWKKPIGDIIDGLTRFAGWAENPEKNIKDPETAFENCMINAGSKAGWVGDDAERLIQRFQTMKELATQHGDALAAAQAEGEIKHIKKIQGKILVEHFKNQKEIADQAGDKAAAANAEARIEVLKEEFGLTDADFTFEMDSEED